jgi:hypothetical protein
MRRIPLDKLADVGSVAPTRPLSRLERLQRWAEVLEAWPAEFLRPLRRVELYSPAERAQLRADQSPLSVAFADPLLRAEGLPGDRLGDGRGFFGLTERDLHALVCDCRYGGRMQPKDVARRVRALGDPNPLRRLWARFTL